MNNLIFISSMGHSGSTLVDLLVGAHPRFIGLGEIANVIKPGPTGLELARQAVCSCGHTMDECVFWSQVDARLQSNGNLSFIEKYKMVFDTFEQVFGHDYIPVDSSKALAALKLLNTNLASHIRVLYILKDVRSYTVSQIDTIKRLEENFFKKYILTRPAFHFWGWYRRNRKLQGFFSDQDMDVLQIGYEELCLYPHLMVQKISDFLDVETESSMLDIGESKSHIILGNRMRHQTDKRLDITYDHRWFFRNEWIRSAFLLPHIMRYNAREVYSNHTEMVWKK